MRFEIWLLGNTISVQKSYWASLKKSKWNKEKTEMPKYSILEAIIEEEPNFDELSLLSQKIEKRLVEVSSEIINTVHGLNEIEKNEPST